MTDGVTKQQINVKGNVDLPAISAKDVPQTAINDLTAVWQLQKSKKTEEMLISPAGICLIKLFTKYIIHCSQNDALSSNLTNNSVSCHTTHNIQYIKAQKIDQDFVKYITHTVCLQA